MAGRNNRQSQQEFLLDYYKQHPNQDIPHPVVVDWAVERWKQLYKTAMRDPDRAIRSLADKGLLVKVRKGVYRYDPDLENKWVREEFTPEQKEAIKKRDEYRCVFCGIGPEEGVEIHVDHIVSPQRGGKATLDNGWTLCARHNYMKKNLGVMESGKKFFISLYNAAKAHNDKLTFDFCREILEVYERHKINGHIKWHK